MSHDAFLRAIIDRPDDDLPRLVYADYLEENGDPARAEFIRVQCELAGMADDDPRRPGLEDREHELLEERERLWCRSTPHWQEWEWRRGYIEQVSCYFFRDEKWWGETTQHPISRVEPVWDLGTDPISRYEPIYDAAFVGEWIGAVESAKVLDQARTLDLTSWETIAVGSALYGTRVRERLRELNLSQTPGLSDLAPILRDCPNTRSLTHLTFGGRSGAGFRWGDAENETLDVSTFNEALRQTRLESLAAFDCGLTSDGLRAMLLAPWAESLKSLDVSDNPLAPDGWRAFADARPGLRLDRLDVSGTPLAGISLEPVLNSRACETLTKLEIDRIGSARTNLEVLAASAFWSQAAELRMHSGTIPAATLEPLTQSPGPPALRLLDLSANYLRTDGVAMLAAAPWVGSLTWLGLSQNYLDDNALRILAGSGRFPKLRTLRLARNNTDQFRSDGEEITDAGVAALASARSLANLRILTLSYTGISDRSVGVVLNAPHWRLSGLGLAGVGLTENAVRELAASPRLARLNWLDLSGNPGLSGSALMPLAESPYLSRLCELDVGGVYVGDKVRDALRARLGPRLSD